MLAERSEEDELEMPIAEIRAVASNHQESVRLQVFRQYAGEDVAYQQVLHYIQDGFPEHEVSYLRIECYLRSAGDFGMFGVTCPLMKGWSFMAVDWSFQPRCNVRFCHSSTRHTRGLSERNKEPGYPFTGPG